ncbi:H-type lectin domain-containing protein [Pseudoalteromonas ruthenica]|uniref:H-type lectin domain-containing protein n=1 Tax=Pseudoalteromonas ruthenica TaxID=151081 RepID=UPI00110B688B|nr:H-type lectin domain-containing protein [Pseudoalteromonas ruthenica]TMO46978.1 agglutinin biogenesis protein MshQ [Pseudoalteromonas ruthenica]TMO52925.1 agglutinin biogenesis protein MshQ [Pseudoalteromonas ruthenica]
MRKFTWLWLCLLLVSSFFANAVPKVEGRFIELQNTYDNPIWTTINFSQAYDEPPAVFMLSTNQGSNPAIVKIRNVTRTGFEALPLEPPGEDGEHITMGAHYLAIEYGVHEFEDGLFMEVGKTTLDQSSLQYGSGSTFTLPQSYKRVNFDYEFSERPVLVHSIQTLNSNDTNPPRDALRPFLTVAIESGSLDTQGVNMALEASETQAGNIVPETIAYLAVIEGSNRLFNDDDDKEIYWEALFSGERIDGWDDGCDDTFFNNNYSSSPLVAASKISRNGADGGWLRSCRLNSSRLGLTVDEDRYNDSERNHTVEEAAIIAMTSNFVFSGNSPSCEIVFPGALATFNSAPIRLVDGVIVDDPNGGVVQTEILEDTSTEPNKARCDGVQCIASGVNAITTAQAEGIPTIDNDGSSSPNLPSELIGDYFIDASLVQMVNTTYEVLGKTRIFIKSSSAVAPLLQISNTQLNISGSPSDLTIYVDGNISIANSNVTAYMMSTGTAIVGAASKVRGALTAGGDIDTGAQSEYLYVRPNNLAGICGKEVIETVNHYRFELADNKGSTCAAKPVTLKACANVSCSQLYSQPTSVDLLPATDGNNTWLPSDSVTFTGQTDLQYARSGGGNVKLAITNPMPSSQFRCFIGGSEVGIESCKVKFEKEGMVFRNLTDGDETIVTQFAGKPSDAGVNAKTYVVEACGNGNQLANKTLDSRLKFNCGAGQSCTNSLLFNHQGDSYNLSTLSFSDIPLRFDADSRAEFTIAYPDAGQLSISGELDVPINPNSNKTTTLSGASNQFVVRPFGFDVTASGANSQALDANGSLYRLTGERFPVTVRPVQWQSGDDTNNDGVPDNYQNLRDNLVAKHYVGMVGVTAENVIPAGGKDGVFDIDDESAFKFEGNDTQVISNISYDQVGVINVIVESENSYLGSGKVRGQANNVGRFAPSDFSMKNASIEPACPSGDFTYFNQPFNTVTYTLVAENHKNEVMRNYRAGFDKLYTPSLIAVHGGDELENRIINVDSLSWPQNALQAGEIKVTESDVTFIRQTNASQIDGPYDNTNINLLLKAEQLEGAVLNGQPCGGDCSQTIASPVKLRYGRLALQDNYGPANEELLVPMTAQFWNGQGWAINNLDNCSQYKYQSLSYPSDLTVTGNNGQLNSGGYKSGEGIEVDANGNTGSYSVSYPAPDWLLWDWNGDNAADENPSATLKFGTFRGNDRIIYWREQLN